MPRKRKGSRSRGTLRTSCWNYSAPAHYFLTMITKKRKPILGDIWHGKMYHSPEGQIVADEILNIPTYHQRIVLDEWVVMPDHIHLLVTLKDFDFENGIATPVPFYPEQPEYALPRNIKRRKMLIPLLVGKLKMLTSKRINETLGTPGVTNWQHDYYDIIVLNKGSYSRIKQYIINNPKKWKKPPRTPLPTQIQKYTDRIGRCRSDNLTTKSG